MLRVTRIGSTRSLTAHATLPSANFNNPSAGLTRTRSLLEAATISSVRRSHALDAHATASTIRRRAYLERVWGVVSCCVTLCTPPTQSNGFLISPISLLQIAISLRNSFRVPMKIICPISVMGAQRRGVASWRGVAEGCRFSA